MRALRPVLASLVVTALFLPVTSGYHVDAAPGVQKEQKERVAGRKKTPVRYVCPMHDDVTSKSRGACPKCKMTLVKKRITKTMAASGI